MLKNLWFIFQMELRLILRRSQDWLYPLEFFLIIVSLFPLVFSPDPIFLQKYIPGCIWIAALFASLFAMETVFLHDLEEGSLEQFLISETSLTFFLLAKLAAQWLMTGLPLVLLTPFLAIIFHLTTTAGLVLSISLLLGTPILTLITCLGVALTLGLRQQGVMLGVLLLPLVTPVLIFGVTIVQQSQLGFSIIAPLSFLAGLSVLSITLLPWAIANTLRISFDD